MSEPTKVKESAGKRLPQFGVDWKDRSVTLFTRDGFILARSNDSAKGKIYESIVALESDRDQLRERVGELSKLVSDHIQIFALQALRDSADPKTLEGWRVLQAAARAALAKERP